MNRIEFLNDLSNYCEFEGSNIKLDTILKTIDGYDSLSVMSMIAFIDENFGQKFSAKQFQNLTDFNSLIDLIGKEKFDND